MSFSVRSPRHPSRTLLVVASIMASMFLFGLAAAAPGDVFGATSSKTALCGVNLRTSDTMSARVRTAIHVSTRVTVVATVSGGSWRITCAGRTSSAQRWYRISAINGKSVKGLYGLAYLYAPTSAFKITPITRYAACATSLRSSPSRTATVRWTIPTNTRVTIATTVVGSSWSFTCAGRQMTGNRWYRISMVGTKTVRSARGVAYLYAPTGDFKTSTATPTPAPASGSKALGVYVHGSAYDFSLLDSYAGTVGAMPAMALSYNDWAANGDGGNLFPRTMLDAFAARGIVPIVTWEPWDWNGSGSNATYKLANILAGNFDSYIGSWVSAARSYGKPIYLRFAHEMNGSWYPWGVGVNGNTPAQYVSVWRKIVTMFRNGGATNVRFVWSPNVVDTDKPLTGLYPGDSYVDMTAMDGYNWGTAKASSWGGWRSFNQIFGSTYNKILAIAPSKPIFVAEMASTEYGGDKAAWIRATYAAIPTSFPKLSGVIWFDQNKETDWRVNSSTSALSAYRGVAAKTTWTGDLP